MYVAEIGTEGIGIQNPELTANNSLETTDAERESSRKLEIGKEIAKSRYLKGIVGQAFGLHQDLDLATQLGLTEGYESEYVTLLIGKELIADRQMRRRHTGYPDEELSDVWLKKAMLLSKKTIEAEQVYSDIATYAKEVLSNKIGDQRENLINLAVHNLISIGLSEGRKSEKSSRHAEKGAPRMVINDKDEYDREIKYWKDQITSSSPQ